MTDLLTHIRNSTGRDFESLCRDLLLPIFPDLTRAEPLNDIDQAGIDLYVMSENGTDLELAVQCKGFDRAFSQRQLAQCAKSLASLRKACRLIKKYIIIINRDNEDGKLRSGLADAVSNVVERGFVSDAVVMYASDLHLFLHNSYEKVIAKQVTNFNRRFVRGGDGFGFYMPDVPYLEWTGEKWSLGFGAEYYVRRWIGGARPRGSALVVVSQFGFGKTSLLANVANLCDLPGTFMIPLTQFSKEDFVDGKLFVIKYMSMISYDAKYSPIVQEEMFLILFSLMLRRESIMLFDGVDESPALYEQSGLRDLFKIMNDCYGSVVFSVRDEFWSERHGNIISACKAVKFACTPISLVEWGDDQICRFLDIYEGDGRPLSREYGQLAAVIRSGQYNARLGDIPKRPLFLKMLVQTAQDGKLVENNISALYADYFSKKLEHDSEAIIGSSNRPIPLPKEDRFVRVDLLMEILTALAGTMFNPGQNGLMRLERVVKEDKLKRAVKSVGADIMTIEVLMNSVLVPADIRNGMYISISFAHLSFQEWFTARWIVGFVKDFSQCSFVVPVGVGRFLPPEYKRLMESRYKRRLADKEKVPEGVLIHP